MLTPKYYEKIKEAQKTAQSPQPNDFDINRLKRGGFDTKLFANHWLYSFLRTFFPIARFRRFAMVTRYDDVKLIRERPDVFEVPFGLEMTELAGTNFVLGMNPGVCLRVPDKSSPLRYHPDDVQKIVRYHQKRQASPSN